LAGILIPGHAGRFEASLVMALRPDLITPEGLARTRDMSATDQGLFGDLSGATMQVHGAWAKGVGYTDYPAAATAAEGEAILEIVVQRVAGFFTAFCDQGLSS
jgi:creatinine amidohydrolase